MVKSLDKAILVDHDEYLLHLSKYIHRNPLDAKMVSYLEDTIGQATPATSINASLNRGCIGGRFMASYN